MGWIRCAALASAVVLFGALLDAQQDVTQPALSPDQIEAFLLKAEIRGFRPAGEGVTNSQRVTMSDGSLTHDAHVQTVDIARNVFEAGAKTELNFRDSYRYNVAGYRLARLLGVVRVPVSVERRVSGNMAAVTWWLDDVLMDEKERTRQGTRGPDSLKLAYQTATMYVFDELIQNMDRNQGNIVYTSDFTMWLIDHTRAFRLGKSLRNPEQLTRCHGALLEGMRSLTADSLKEAVGEWLTRPEQEALLARRDAIVKHFDERIATRGAENVLFDY